MPRRLFQSVLIALILCAHTEFSAAAHAKEAAAQPDCGCRCERCAEGIEAILHPRTGKLIVVHHGAQSTHYHYNADGLLADAETSDGRRIALHYNPAQQIERMALSQAQPPQRRTLTFRYGEHDKPTYIALEGIGTITVRYDAQGEIQSVHSPQGARMALGVTQAFQELMRLIRPPCRAN